MGFDSVVAILIDGARPDVMQRMAAEGQLPNLKKHFVDAGGFASAVGVFPSLSGPAHLPMLTGVHPGNANLPGIRWAERPTTPWGFLGHTRSYMTPFRHSKLARDIPAHVQTLFHHIDGLADINTWFVRGCGFLARRTRFSKAASFARSLVTSDWYGSDHQAEQALTKALESGYRSAFAVFPAVDELGHRFGPLCDESYETYRQFDIRLGRLMDTLTRLGRLDRTLVVLSSDHGQTGTHTHIDLERVVAEIYPRTLAYPLLWRHMLNAEAAVMVSGNSMANVYVIGQDSWKDKPDFERGGRATELRDRIASHPGIDHVIYQRGWDIVLHTHDRGRFVIAQDGTTSVEGEHPLGENPEGDYPDVVEQLKTFYRSSRAGDLVVCAHSGYDLRARFEYQPHKGSHGCLVADHLMVPAAINARWADDTPLRAVDIFPSILQALGKPVPFTIDGRAVGIESV